MKPIQRGNNTINLRYSLMKWDRKSISSRKFQNKDHHYSYLNRSSFGYKSRASTLSGGISNLKSTRRILNNDRYNDNPKLGKKPADCTIYFPLKGLISKQKNNDRHKPKFIIVPKDEYVKSHPEFHNRKSSLHSTLSYKNVGKGVLPGSDQDVVSQPHRSSPGSQPKRRLFKIKENWNVNKNTRNKIYGIRNNSRRRKSANKSRQSAAFRRDKVNHILDPLIRRKAKHLKLFNKKNSMKMEVPIWYETINSTQCGTSKNREHRINSKLDMPNHYNSGYGEIINIIQRKKARIQSAHPVIKNKVGLKTHTSILDTSYTFSKREQSSRPTSSAKKNMTEYLSKVISIASRKQYPNSKNDVKKLVAIRDRYSRGRVGDVYHVNEIKAVLGNILQEIGSQMH